MKMGLMWGLAVLLGLCLGVSCILEYEIPKNTECFRNLIMSPNSTGNPIECVHLFTSYIKGMQYRLNYTEEQMNWILDLERGMMQKHSIKKRHKRQAMLGIRQDCRTLSPMQRNNLFGTVRQLKETPIGNGNNEYDTLADIHNEMNSQGAHGGPSFLGWHRVYLSMFEEALNRLREGISLCYWDSTLDFLMEGASQRRTVTFTEAMFGNGRGSVINGPFADWPIGNGQTLRRNIGSPGSSLMRPGVVDAIMYDPAIRSHSQIVVGGQGFPDPDVPNQRINLESEHDNPHVWVGGVMNNIAQSPRDPVFWFHHTFIDYIWEVFRMKLQQLGVDVERDYPFTQNWQFHGWWRPMAGIPGLRNIDGYANRYARQYAPHATCGNGCGGSTEFLYCPSGGADSDRCITYEAEADVAPMAAASGIAAFGAARAGAAGAPAMMSLQQTASVALQRSAQEGPLQLSGPNFSPSVQDDRLNAP
uniref:Tyrosinase n=1 Tax=Pteria penguin TaxID=113549 RepID=A0A2P1AF39_PTEPN|nr:tyrosinase [Pteria penguin]